MSREKTTKENGQVFTSDYIVNNMLDFTEYNVFNGNILQKHIIDNSCGDGAILCEIVRRYCKEYIRHNETIDGLKEELEEYIHGIELEETAYNNCLRNVTEIAKKYGITDIKWDIINEDTLSVTKYDGKMDYVIGNPPYVRVHNLGDKYKQVKDFSFAQDGMTDLYLVFYELGFRMLNENGKLCYITPNSWLQSVAATNMRHYIMENRHLAGLCDLGNFQAFDNVSTYTLIALFEAKHRHDYVYYFNYLPEKKRYEFIDKLEYEEMLIEDKFYIGTKNNLEKLHSIKRKRSFKPVVVKNGFATLADNIFINNVTFEPLTIPILKASTGKMYRGFFPYDENGKPLSKETIFSYSEVAEYLERNKSNLLKNHTEEEYPQYYLYGRSQALKDVYKRKYSINPYIKDVDSIKLIEVPSGTGIYSGFYILTEANFENLREILCSEEFVDYVKMLKHYKSGWYCLFNTKELEDYLNWKFSEKA